MTPIVSSPKVIFKTMTITSPESGVASQRYEVIEKEHSYTVRACYFVEGVWEPGNPCVNHFDKIPENRRKAFDVMLDAFRQKIQGLISCEYPFSVSY